MSGVVGRGGDIVHPLAGGKETPVNGMEFLMQEARESYFVVAWALAVCTRRWIEV